MSLITKPSTFTAGTTILSAQVNSCFDTVYNEVNGLLTTANISPSAGIVDTQLAQITTAGKVSGAALTSFTSIPSAAGVIPTANIGGNTPRVQSVADAATVTPAGDTNDAVDITAIAQAFTIAAPTGTPINFQKLIIRIKDNGTARAITWNAAYVAGGTALPSTTVLSKILILGFMYNTANTLNKWQLIASSQET